MTTRRTFGGRRRQMLSFCIAGVLTLTVSPGARASAWTPLSIGTAGGSMAISRGLDAAFENPAQLGMDSPSGTEFRLFGVGAGINSNGFGFDDYKRYNGVTLSAADKDDILAGVPSEGLRFLADGGATALAMRFGRWTLHTAALGSARGRIDRDAVALLLYGNSGQPKWTFEDAGGEGLAAWEVALSHGRAIGRLAGRPLYAGVSISRIQGLYYGRSDQAFAEFATGTGGLSGTATTDVITSEGGQGWGADAGLAWQATQHWVASFKIENLVHTIRWNDDSKVTHYRLAFDELTADNYDDSLVVSNDESKSLAAFSQGLPAEFHLGFGRRGQRFSISTDIFLSSADRFAYSTTPRVAAAFEYVPVPILPLRFGLAAGGATGFAVGWGAGLHLGPVRINTGFRVDRGLWPGSGYGLRGAVAMDIAI